MSRIEGKAAISFIVLFRKLQISSPQCGIAFDRRSEKSFDVEGKMAAKFNSFSRNCSRSIGKKNWECDISL